MIFYTFFSHEPISYKRHILGVWKLCNSPYSGPYGIAWIRQWLYQACTEFGWLQSSDIPGHPYGTKFPIEFSFKVTSDAAYFVLTIVMYVHFRTITEHFFANHINIFHKTEVQTIILRCSTCLNLNCIKS